VAGALARGRREEALALNPDTISTACPYCLVMLGDAIAAKKNSGDAPDTLEVVDVAQLLARSVRPQHDGVPSPNSAAAD
jgi:Fe-S oxidoreductase